MLIIGELLNGIRPQVARAIAERDEPFVADLARRQEAAGADYLDVCAGTPAAREPEDLLWLAHVVRDATLLPLCLDSANPAALSAVLPEVAAGRPHGASPGSASGLRPPIINSISAEPGRLERLLPLAAEFGCAVIALPLAGAAVPADAQTRMEILGTVMAHTRRAGLDDAHVYVDPLVMAVATGTGSGNVTLETIRRVRREFPRVHVCAGVSNISFGLPERGIINQAFITLALEAGLDSALIDPLDGRLMGAVLAAELVLDRDPYCRAYTRGYKAGRFRG